MVNQTTYTTREIYDKHILQKNVSTSQLRKSIYKNVYNERKKTYSTEKLYQSLCSGSLLTIMDFFIQR